MKKIQLKKPQFRKTKHADASTVSKRKFMDKMDSMLASWDLKKLARNMVLLAIPLAIVASYFGYTRLYLTDERRLWMAINNSMATTSVNRRLTSGGTGNKVIQDQQFFFAPQMVTKSKVTFAQKTATIETNVATEGVSYPDRQYSRYTEFNTNQKKEDGTSPSLDSVLGKWGTNTLTEEDKASAKDGYIGELVTLAVFGNYDANFRAEMIRQMKETKVYTVDYSAALEDTIDEKNVLVIPATVRLKPFATVLQKAFEKAGYGMFAPLNPENYSDNATLRTTFIVNVKDNTMYGIEYGDRQERYTAYGVNITVEEPQSSIPAEELEAIVREEISSAL